MYLLVWSNHFVYISLYSGGVQLCLDQYLFFFFFFCNCGDDSSSFLCIVYLYLRHLLFLFRKKIRKVLTIPLTT